MECTPAPAAAQRWAEDLRLEEVSAGADRGLLEREGVLSIVAEGHGGKTSETSAFLQGSVPIGEAQDQLPA